MHTNPYRYVRNSNFSRTVSENFKSTRKPSLITNLRFQNLYPGGTQNFSVPRYTNFQFFLSRSAHSARRNRPIPFGIFSIEISRMGRPCDIASSKTSLLLFQSWKSFLGGFYKRNPIHKEGGDIRGWFEANISQKPQKRRET